MGLRTSCGQPEGEPTLLYIDLHLVHEVTSPQAFEGLRLANRKVRRPDLTFATIDHNVPTTSDERFQIKDQIAAQQIATLRKNCEAAGIPLFDIGSGRQGIVHVIGPELGLTQPGMTIVCGDSHTSTHGAFGALAFGIGTSEVEHVLATQCVSQTKPRSMRISVSGKLPEGTTSKDLILEIIRRLGTDGGTGLRHRVRRRGRSQPHHGRAHDDVQHEHRMRRARGHGCSRRDDVRLHGGPPVRAEGKRVERSRRAWRQLATDDGATFDREIAIDGAKLEPIVTWGTNPGMSVPVTASIPNPDHARDASERAAMLAALEYMGLTARHPHRRHHRRSRLHRLLHQWPSGRPAGRRAGDSRTQSSLST